jgi:protein phosphatase
MAVLAVADGMGGRQGGATASRIAIETVVEEYAGVGSISDAEMPGASGSDRVSSAIQRANARIRDNARVPELAGMGTTMTVVSLADQTISVGHVGDSRAYLVRNGEAVQLTRDHTWTAERERSGCVSPGEAPGDRRKGVLTRALGIGDEVEVDMSELEINPGDLIVLCSDGLHGRVCDFEIARVVSSASPSNAAKKLVRMANDAGGRDNVTVVVAGARELEPERGRLSRLFRRNKPLRVVTG